MRKLCLLVVSIYFWSPVYCQIPDVLDSEIIEYIRANPNVLKTVKKDNGVGVEDDKGRTVIPPIYYEVTILPTTSKFAEPKFLVNKKSYEGFNLLSLDKTPLYSSDQHAMIQAAPGFIVVTPPTKETSFIVDYNGNQIENLEKSMIQPVIVEKYSSNNGPFYVLGKNGNNGYHLALISKELEFIKPLADHRIKVKEYGIIFSNNSGNGGTLYDLDLEEIWSSEIAIPTHVFANSFVISNQKDYTSGILNFKGDTLFTSELMRFSDLDIKVGVIKYLTHNSNKWGAVSVGGKEIIPAGDATISWVEYEGKQCLEYFDKQKGKDRRYDPIEETFIND